MATTSGSAPRHGSSAAARRSAASTRSRNVMTDSGCRRGRFAPAAAPAAVYASRADGLQRDSVRDAKMPPVDMEQAPLREARQRAADRLQFETQEAAHLLARHPQADLGRRVAARGEPLRQIDDESGDALLGG